MTEKQKRFCDEYLIDCNATRAYLAAYPTVKNSGVARRNGSRLLTYADIRSYINEELEKQHDEKTADAKEVLEYLTSVLRGESEGSEIVVEGQGEGISQAVVVKKPPSEKDRLKAAELIGKRYGLYTDKTELNAVQTVTIVDDVDD